MDVCFHMKMKANPGGQIDLKTMIGRDLLIQLLWEVIEQQSVVMTAERRIGKTTILKKIQLEPRSGWTPVYQDLEKCHSAAEFAMAVYTVVHQFLSAKGKITRRAKELFSSLGGAEVAGLFKLPEKADAHWKDILIRSIEDLVHESEQLDSRLLFLWDEVPYMLGNISTAEGERTAMEVLDVLRFLRQTHGSLRMVITGSIGLHHVIAALKDKNYANSPLNDTATFEVLPLDTADAQELARQLIAGESLPCPDPDAAAAAMAQAAGDFAFYIHHIARALKLKGKPATTEAIAQIVQAQMVDANDPWELRHYRDRIPTYYGSEQQAVLIVLDELATGRSAASLTELLTVLKNASAFDDRERLLDLLWLMENDHYLKRDLEGCYTFRFPLIRKWWKLHRGL